MSTDVTQLRVGTELPPLAVGPITRTTLALFAGGSGDHNPIHIDLDVARAAGLDDVFAQGMLGMAHLGRLLTTAFDVGALQTFRVRFSAITPVGAEPTCHATVTGVHDGIATLDVRVVLADGTTTLQGVATVATDPTSTRRTAT